ncbi:hypothetical protein BDV11DRAFT_188779 [Aspergillus similis]
MQRSFLTARQFSGGTRVILISWAGLSPVFLEVAGGLSAPGLGEHKTCIVLTSCELTGLRQGHLAGFVPVAKRGC